MSLVDFVVPLRLGYINPIISNNFSFQGFRSDELQYALFSLGRRAFEAEIVFEMKKKLYVPATAGELLDWASQNWRGEGGVIALGEEMVPGRIIGLTTRMGVRVLDAYYSGFEPFGSTWSFLGVKKKK